MRLISLSPSAVLASMTLHAAGFGLYHFISASSLMQPIIVQEVKTVEVQWRSGSDASCQMSEASKQPPSLLSPAANDEVIAKPSAIPIAPTTLAPKKSEEVRAAQFEASSIQGSRTKNGLEDQYSYTTKGVEHSNPSPSYPELARREGYEGIVWLRIRVDREGKVEHLKVLETSGFECLDQHAVDAVQEWVFKPAVTDGRAVVSEIDIPIEYALEKN
jgi:TonB family protein